jgi:DedD protein
VSFVVIILPLLLDKEPGPAGPPLDVQIPRQDAGGASTRIGSPAAQTPAASGTANIPEKNTEVAPAVPAAAVVSAEAPSSTTNVPAAETASPGEKREPSAASTKTAESDKAAKVPPPARDKSEQERAQSALHDEAWVVALDAFSDARNVQQLRAKLSAAGVKSYTEAIKTGKGELTRVRAGPFGSKEAAEKARAKLVSMGLKPGAVASR